MFLALLLLTLCLHAVACPRWLTRAWVVNWGGGGGRPHPMAPYRSRPVPMTVVMAAAPAPATPPLGTAPGTGPPAQQESVYTPTAHAGAPGRGDGPWSPPGEGTSLSGGRGPHARVGRWRYGKGHSCRGAAAAPRTGNDLDIGQPPPPPLGEAASMGRIGSMCRLIGEQGGWDARRLEVTASPRPRRPTPAPSPGEAPSMGRADSNFRLTGEHWGWDVRQLRATAGPRLRRPIPAPRPAGAPAPMPQTDPLTPCRLRLELPLVVMAADAAPVGFPLRWARGSDPQCGRRVSVRPQPKRAPRGEVMALGPSRPPPTPGMGQHRLCLGPPRGAVPRGRAPPRPPRRGLEWVVTHPPPARGWPCLAVCRSAPRWPPVRDQGGHCGPGLVMEVPLGPLRARPPAGRPQRQPPLHMALVPGAHVAGGDRRGAAAANPARPHHLLAPPPADPNPGPAATWLEVANAVHALLPLVSDVWWATLPEPGEIHATARWPDVLRRFDPSAVRDLLHEVA